MLACFLKLIFYWSHKTPMSQAMILGLRIITDALIDARSATGSQLPGSERWSVDALLTDGQ